MEGIDRREFLVKSAAGVAVASAVMIGPKTWAQANDKLRVAIVGLFGRGKSHIDAFGAMPDVEVAALCDCDRNILESAARNFEMRFMYKPKLYTDMREIFDDPEIDAVTFATPNHWHALGTVWACQAGKDVYVEKPCSHNVWEGRQAVAAARKYNRIVQMGAQSRSSAALKEAVQKMKEGVIGEVYMAKGLCYKWRSTIGTQPVSDPPEALNYDLWTGPAELKPFSRNYHPYKWHWFWNTGNGDIGNQGVHEMDKARWGLGVGLPKKVHSAGGKYMFEDDQETPNYQISTFEYPDEKKIIVFEVRPWITNDEAGMGVVELDATGKPRVDNAVGNIFLGKDGVLVMPNYSSYQIFMGKNRETTGRVSMGGDHFRNFIDACRSRKVEDLNLDIEDGHISSAMCHMANTSYRLGRSLDFDPATERYVGDDEANEHLSRQYRAPYVVPAEV